MVYDIFGQQIADYNGTTLDKENIYRGGQLLAVYETASTCYKTIADFVTAFYQGALNRFPTSTELSQWTLIFSEAQAQGNASLIKAAQDLGTALFTSGEYTTTDPGAYVTDLYEAYLQRSPDSGGYQNWMAAIAGGSTFAQVRTGFAYSMEFQGNVVRLCPGVSSSTSSSARLSYVLNDVQGSSRALMNNSGSGTSTIIARHDYLPFGEEIGAGIGLRTTTQKYSTTDRARQRFGLTERDEATGLDHTWFRKYESSAGRWTSPDPLSGSMGDPQSFNRYSYTTNDPVNLVDPSGLMPCVPGDFSPQCDSSGFGGWGWGDLGNRDRRAGLATILAREEAFDRSLRSQSRYYSRWLEGSPPPWASSFIGSPWFGYDPGEKLNNFTGEQCVTLQKLLQREAQVGTRKAAALSQITYPYPGNDKLLQPFNSSSVPNLRLHGGFTEPNVFDLDWAATLRGMTTDGGELVMPKYAVGKTIWSIAKIITAGETSGNPVPFTDPGERHAVEWAMGGGAFKDLFTEDFMRVECPLLNK